MGRQHVANEHQSTHVALKRCAFDSARDPSHTLPRDDSAQAASMPTIHRPSRRVLQSPRSRIQNTLVKNGSVRAVQRRKLWLEKPTLDTTGPSKPKYVERHSRVSSPQSFQQSQIGRASCRERVKITDATSSVNK